MEECPTTAAKSPPQPDLCTTPTEPGMGPYGPPQPAVFGDSTIRVGSTSELSGTPRSGLSMKRGLIARGHSGFWHPYHSSHSSYFTFRREPESSKRPRLI